MKSVVKSMRYFILFAYFCPSIGTSGGIAVGNGGNIVRCGRSFDYQSLDYILSQKSFGKSVSIVKATSTRESLKRISKLLQVKAPWMFRSFQSYVRLLMNSDENQTYVWRIRQDETQPAVETDVHLPFSCMHPEFAFFQNAIIRLDSDPNRVVFLYTPEAIDEIKDQPIQFSFLLVHEWLWNFSSNIVQIRKFNYFLHSTLFDEYSAEQVAALTQELNLKPMRE